MPKSTMILDIDETLIHAYTKPSEIEKMIRCDIWNANPLVRARTFTVHGDKGVRWWVIKRPYLDEFIDECFNNFDQVIVWTAGCKAYADDIVNHVFSGHPQPHYVFNYDHCAENDKADLLHKPILSLRKYGVEIDPEYTFIVDDRPRNFLENEDNGINIKGYTPQPSLGKIIMDYDDSLKLLINWMKSSKFQPHIKLNPRVI